MPLERQHLWAYAGLAAAAVFAAGSLTALSLVNDEREAQARNQNGSSAVLGERYRAAIADITSAESARAQAECELEERIVEAVQLEERATDALDTAAVVEDATLIFPRAARVNFEQVRAGTIEALSPGFTTEADAELAARYVDVSDVVAACLADRATAESPAPSPLTETAVEEAEARAEAAAVAPELDTARLDALDQTVTALAGPLLEVADARVTVTGLEETDAALASAAVTILTATTSGTTLDGLEALTAHAQAAVDMAARRVQQPTPRPDPEPSPSSRPRPVNPAPPAPTPRPTVAPEPSPAPSVEPGDGAPGDPVEP